MKFFGQGILISQGTGIRYIMNFTTYTVAVCDYNAVFAIDITVWVHLVINDVLSRTIP